MAPEKLCCRSVLLALGHLQRGLSMTIPQLGVRLLLQQPIYNTCVAIVRGLRERSPIGQCSPAPVAAAVRPLCMTLTSSSHECGASLLVRDIHSRSAAQEQLYHASAALPTCDNQRSLTNTVSPLYASRAGQQ